MGRNEELEEIIRNCAIKIRKVNIGTSRSFLIFMKVKTRRDK